MTNIAGILLAAGFSRRFGVADKLMHRLSDGRPLAQVAAQNLLQALPFTVAVVRPGNLALAELLTAAGAQVVYSAADARDMSASLAAAVRHAAKSKPAVAGFVIALADMPYIRPQTIGNIAAALAGGNGIVVPVYRQQRGHPVAFAAKFRGELERLSGDEGARSIVLRHPHEVCLLECDDPGIVADIDTPSDLRAF